MKMFDHHIHMTSRTTTDYQNMADAGISESDIKTVVWDNPVAFFGQSGRLDLGDDNLSDGSGRPRVDQTELWEGNSVLRGQEAVIEPAE
jgi:hypothetical protein